MTSEKDPIAEAAYDELADTYEAADDEGEQTNIRENDRIDAIVTKMENIIEEEDISHGFGQYSPPVDPP